MVRCHYQYLHDSTSDPLGCGFGLVKRNKSRDSTNTKSGDSTTSDEERNRSCSSLEDNTNGENDQPCHETQLATEEIASGRGQEGTKEGTDR